MRRRLAWALIALALCCVANARAQTAARIVLVGDPDRDLTRQLLAEAKQAGFVVIADSDESAGQDAPSVAERYAAVGVLRAGAASSVELWLPGNADDAPSSITLRARPGEAGAFAVRVIEEVRARVVALHLPEPRAPAARPRAPDSERRSAVPTPSLGPNLPLLEAGAGLAATTAAGGMGTSVEAELDAHARLASRFGASLLAQLPLSRNEFSALEGTGRARIFLFGAELHWLTWQHSRWRVDTGAGAGLLWLRLRGDAAAGYLGKSDQLFAGVYFADSALSFELGPWLALRGALSLGVAAPRPNVRFGNDEVASWGRFFGSGALGLELSSAH